jgi:hypothetical protein
MNFPDEQLRAAAIEAARVFPPGGELSPLRLPTSAGAGRTGRSEARSAPVRAAGRASAWVIPLAAAAAIVVVAVSVTAIRQVATRTGGAGQSARPGHARATESQGSQRRALDALVIEAFAPATGPQNDAGARLQWLIQARERAPFARCMAASGYHVSSAPTPFDLAAGADNTQMPDLPRIARTHEFVSPTASPAGPLTGPEQKAFLACQERVSARYRPLRAAAAGLQSSWWRIIFRIQVSPQVRAAIPALSACAARYGFPRGAYGRVFPPIRSFGDFMNWIAGFIDGAGSRSASAGELNALNRHWTTVFLACSRPIVGIWQRQQLAVQPGFLARHAAQLRRVDKLAWQLLGH